MHWLVIFELQPCSSVASLLKREIVEEKIGNNLKNPRSLNKESREVQQSPTTAIKPQQTFKAKEVYTQGRKKRIAPESQLRRET